MDDVIDFVLLRIQVELEKFQKTKTIPHDNRGKYRDWETDRKSTRLNSSHRL